MSASPASTLGFLHPLRPPARTEKPARDLALEGVRGLCAYAVV
jgi:hypothetical protein